MENHNNHLNRHSEAKKEETQNTTSHQDKN